MSGRQRPISMGWIVHKQERKEIRNQADQDTSRSVISITFSFGIDCGTSTICDTFLRGQVRTD